MKRSITILHIKKKNPLWDQCDNLSKVSKQLYNVGLYILRQGLVKEDRWISSKELYDTTKYGKVKTKPSFSGKRVKRGLYRTQQDHLINADINGSLNIMRKVFKKSLDDLITDKQFIHNCASPSFLGIAQ